MFRLMLALVLLVVAGLDDFDTSDGDVVSYLAIFGLIVADGVIPIFPGETMLIVGATLSAAGDLNIWLVVLCGVVGAFLGDSGAFWMGKHAQGPLRARLSKIAGEENIEKGEGMFRRHGNVIITGARFIPGGRFVVMITAGGLIPYWTFVPPAALGAIAWALVSSLIPYFLGQAIDSFWASLMISLMVPVVLIAGYGFVRRLERAITRDDDGEAAQEPLPEAAGESPPQG